MCLQLYHTGIKHQQRGEHGQAKELYREILESEVLEEVWSHPCRIGNGIEY